MLRATKTPTAWSAILPKRNALLALAQAFSTRLPFDSINVREMTLGFETPQPINYKLLLHYR